MKTLVSAMKAYMLGTVDDAMLYAAVYAVDVRAPKRAMSLPERSIGSCQISQCLTSSPKPLSTIGPLYGPNGQVSQTIIRIAALILVA